MKVCFWFDSVQVQSEWNDSATAREIAKTLPVQSVIRRWGDEIYFEISAKLPDEKATLDLEVGDIGYWPEGACLCLFFGKTPASVDERPRPASGVNLVGKFKVSPAILRKVKSGTSVGVVLEV